MKQKSDIFQSFRTLNLPMSFMVS